MARQRLSKSAVEGLSPGTADVLIWDAALPGFGVPNRREFGATLFNTVIGLPAPRNGLPLASTGLS